jgi:hypothetical protein
VDLIEDKTMGQETDLLFLRWLKDQPGGRGLAHKSPFRNANLKWLETHGFVERDKDA